MMVDFVLFFMIVLCAALLVFLLVRQYRLVKEFEQNKDHYSQQIHLFNSEYAAIQEHYISRSEEKYFTTKWQELYEEIKKYRLPKKHPLFQEVEAFKSAFCSLTDTFRTANENFMLSECEKHKAFFSDIDGKSLDEQQKEAVITDEDRILVLAGAGSGKTLTIAAKVKYLCELKHINPQDILLISFTRKSAQEMTDRIQHKLGMNAEATTFHKLGLDIITRADGARPEIADDDELNRFIQDFFDNHLLNYPDLVKTLTEYFSYYLDIPNDLGNYSSLGEYYEAEKDAALETLKTKYERENYIREKSEEKAKTHLTLKNEKVKSKEETLIANFLFLHGINYEYEKRYPFESDDPSQKAYHPDFYLTDYDIYLEHFGISKEGTVPWLSKVEEKKYLEGIRWKRDFHKKNKTTLIETYSYYQSEGILLKKLEEKLRAKKVKFHMMDTTDIFYTVYASKSNKYFSEFIKLCCTFITLFKSNGYKTEYLDTLQKQYVSNHPGDFLRERTSRFLGIIKILLTAYQQYLSDNNTIDFSDMINLAAEKVSSGCDIPSYRYIIVDEYQDISQSRFHLLKAIADQTRAKVFCVGDDWQSIYRFAGSDISLFTDFEKYFGYTKVLKIEKTYRNSQQLIDEASRFIKQNPFQLRKDLHSDKNINYPLVFLGYEDNPKYVLQKAIDKIAADSGTNSSILLLGRTNYDTDIIQKTGLFRIFNEKIEYLPLPELKINFLSVHKSKGLEADNVIILNFKNDKLGFPNQIADDEVLNFVLTHAESFKYAEERRLFYVALTRTKNRTYILTDNKNPSPFFKEFTESESVCFVAIEKQTDENHIYCPRCKTGTLLKVENNGKSFVGCSNFPKCDYILHNTSVLSHPKKCPACGGFLVIRKDKNKHRFIGCTNYPYCTYSESIKKENTSLFHQW